MSGKVKRMKYSTYARDHQELLMDYYRKSTKLTEKLMKEIRGKTRLNDMQIKNWYARTKKLDKNRELFNETQNPTPSNGNYPLFPYDIGMTPDNITQVPLPQQPIGYERVAPASPTSVYSEQPNFGGTSPSFSNFPPFHDHFEMTPDNNHQASLVPQQTESGFEQINFDGNQPSSFSSSTYLPFRHHFENGFPVVSDCSQASPNTWDPLSLTPQEPIASSLGQQHWLLNHQSSSDSWFITGPSNLEMNPTQPNNDHTETNDEFEEEVGEYAPKKYE